MNEYCEEDIATALGTTLHPKTTGLLSSGQANPLDDVWSAATSLAAAAPTGPTGPTAGAVPLEPTTNGSTLLVTRKSSIVQISKDNQHKMNMVRSLCSRLKQLYEPKCCTEKKACCSGAWRSRFASRPDALRYCHLVREAVEGRFSSAMRLATDEMRHQEEKLQTPPPYPLLLKSSEEDLNLDCRKGGKYEHDLRCGSLGDGTKLRTDGGRSLPSYAMQADRIRLLRQARDEVERVSKKVHLYKMRLDNVKELLANKKISPSSVQMKLSFTSRQPIDSADFAGSEEGATPTTLDLLSNVVALSLYNVHEDVVTVGPIVIRPCTREKMCKFGLSEYWVVEEEEEEEKEQESSNNTSVVTPPATPPATPPVTPAPAVLLEVSAEPVEEESWIDHETNVVIRFSNSKEVSRVLKIVKTEMYQSTLDAAFQRVMFDSNITRSSVSDAKEIVGAPQSPPQWYVDQVESKIERAKMQYHIMNECGMMSKRYLVLMKRKKNLEVNAAILIEKSKPHAKERDQIERLELEMNIVQLNLTSCEASGRLLYLQSSNNQLETTETIELEKKIYDVGIELHSVVQHGRLRASLGSLSLKASRITSEIERETKVVKRARLEAQLAELNMVSKNKRKKKQEKRREKKQEQNYSAFQRTLISSPLLSPLPLFPPPS